MRSDRIALRIGWFFQIDHDWRFLPGSKWRFPPDANNRDNRVEVYHMDVSKYNAIQYLLNLSNKKMIK